MATLQLAMLAMSLLMLCKRQGSYIPYLVASWWISGIYLLGKIS
jgi:hypothetical protein